MNTTGLSLVSTALEEALDDERAARRIVLVYVFLAVVLTMFLALLAGTMVLPPSTHSVAFWTRVAFALLILWTICAAWPIYRTVRINRCLSVFNKCLPRVEESSCSRDLAEIAVTKNSLERAGRQNLLVQDLWVNARTRFDESTTEIRIETEKWALRTTAAEQERKVLIELDRMTRSPPARRAMKEIQRHLQHLRRRREALQAQWYAAYLPFSW